MNKTFEIIHVEQLTSVTGGIDWAALSHAGAAGLSPGPGKQIGAPKGMVIAGLDGAAAEGVRPIRAL